MTVTRERNMIDVWEKKTTTIPVTITAHNVANGNTRIRPFKSAWYVARVYLDFEVCTKYQNCHHHHHRIKMQLYYQYIDSTEHQWESAATHDLKKISR